MILSFDMSRIVPLVLLLAFLAAPSHAEPPTSPDTEKSYPPRDDSAAETLGWRLATKAYTFRALTLFETIDISKKLGVKYFELNPNQKVSHEIRAPIDSNLPQEVRALIKAKFAEAGVIPANFGVIKLTADEAADRKIFDLARDLGVKTIVSEPDADALSLLDRLCDEYQINVAIHNHPEPSHYWNPATVLKAIEGHSPRIGACADVGHWTRSGLDTVEALRQLEGHIITLHFKDVNESKTDVPWGTGKSNVRGMLEELRRQNFHGVFSMEYETEGGKASLEDLEQSIVFFDTQAREIAERN